MKSTTVSCIDCPCKKTYQRIWISFNKRRWAMEKFPGFIEHVKLQWYSESVIVWAYPRGIRKKNDWNHFTCLYSVSATQLCGKGSHGLICATELLWLCVSNHVVEYSGSCKDQAYPDWFYYHFISSRNCKSIRLKRMSNKLMIW